MAETLHTIVPEILDGHIELAAEALEGLSFQSHAAARFLRQGNIPAAIETYRRCVTLHRDYASPNMRKIAGAIGTGGSNAS